VTSGQFTAALRTYRLGTHDTAQFPAILPFPAEEGDFLAEVDALPPFFIAILFPAAHLCASLTHV
jgi:hypothetical protein